MLQDLRLQSDLPEGEGTELKEFNLECGPVVNAFFLCLLPLRIPHVDVITICLSQRAGEMSYGEYPGHHGFSTVTVPFDMEAYRLKTSADREHMVAGTVSSSLEALARAQNWPLEPFLRMQRRFKALNWEFEFPLMPVKVSPDKKRKAGVVVRFADKDVKVSFEIMTRDGVREALIPAISLELGVTAFAYWALPRTLRWVDATHVALGWGLPNIIASVDGTEVRRGRLPHAKKVTYHMKNPLQVRGDFWKSKGLDEEPEMPLPPRRKPVNDGSFWTLIDCIRAQCKGDRDLMEKDLSARLRSMCADEIANFARSFRAEMDRANHWNILGPAMIIGCSQSEDGFTDFRSWLIFQGKQTFERVLHDPDSLADIPVDDPLEEWYMECDYQPALIFKEISGQDLELDEPGTYVSGEPLEDQEDLAKRFPRLWEKFRQL